MQRRHVATAKAKVDHFFLLRPHRRQASCHHDIPNRWTRRSYKFGVRRDYGLRIVNEFSRQHEDGQRGIGSEDTERGAVYVKVLAWM